MTYKDRTWCIYDCANLDCDRNKAHIDDDWAFNIDWMEFENCEDYINPVVGENK